MTWQFHSHVYTEKNRDAKRSVHASGLLQHQSQQPKDRNNLNVYQEWIHKMWQIHTIAYYAAIKRNKVPIGATMWMNPENLKLSERRQTQKDKFHDSTYMKYLDQANS